MLIQNKDEALKRDKLRYEKPLVYEKTLKFKEKFEKGESIAIIQHQLDYACNFKCTHCSIKGRIDPKRPKLTLDEIRDVADQADALGLARWVLTGGEPLIYPHLDKLIEAIDPKRFYISCDTNGWFLDYAKADWLKSIGVDRIQLSLDGLTSEVHDTWRKSPGSWRRCMYAIDNTLEVGMSLFIQTCVTRS